MTHYNLLKLDEIDPDHGTKGLEVETPNGPLSLFLVRLDARLYAYRNHCPHTGVELNWLPDQFLDLDRHYIQCATHDARFRIEDGLCVFGPCAGDRLTPITVSILNGQIGVEL